METIKSAAAAVGDARPMSVVGYVRTSTRGQTLSAEVQRAAIVDWCKDRGARLMDVFEDVGVSGAAVISGRPGLWAAMATLGAKRANVLLVSRRDRLARDVGIAGQIERMAHSYGASVEAADDESGPGLTLMLQVSSAFAEYAKAGPAEARAAAIVRDLVADGMTIDEITAALADIMSARGAR